MKLIVLLFILVSQVTLADSPKPIFKLINETLSPCGVVIEHYSVGEQNYEKYRNSDDGIGQYWISDYDHRSHRALLLVYNRHADVVLSPNGEHLIVNSHPVSDRSNILLFERTDKIHYKSVASNYEKQIWAFFMKENHFLDPQAKDRRQNPSAGVNQEDDNIIPFDHSYIDCVAWSHDGSAFIVKLLGYNVSPNNNREWFCVYDLKGNHPTLDMKAMNRGSILHGVN